MSNPTVPAAAEGLPGPNPSRATQLRDALVDAVGEASNAALVLRFLEPEILAGPDRGPVTVGVEAADAMNAAVLTMTRAVARVEAAADDLMLEDAGRHTASAPVGTSPLLFSTEIDAQALAGLSIQQLSDLYDACRTQMDVAAGTMCQPCFQSRQQAHIFNRAGEQADLFHELAARCLIAIRDEAAKRVPADRGEGIARAWLLTRAETNLRDDLLGLAALVAEEAAALAELEALEKIR